MSKPTQEQNEQTWRIWHALIEHEQEANEEGRPGDPSAVFFRRGHARGIISPKGLRGLLPVVISEDTADGTITRQRMVGPVPCPIGRRVLKKPSS